MIKSMTAFGRAKREGDRRTVTVELRSVNSRFFECSVRLPRAYAFLEDKIKSYIQKHAVTRAKVDVYVTVEKTAGGPGTVAADLDVAAGYLDALRRIRDAFGLLDDITTVSIAHMPDVLVSSKEEEDADAVWQEVLPVLEEAVHGYVTMRTAEGDKIAADLEKKLTAVSDFSDEVEKISLSDTVGYRDKLEARLRAILQDNGVTIDENRLLTECAVWADKIAIDEELVRLRSHFGAFRDIAAQPEPSGRKLDFLMQEMNRETNTIGSKANNARIARLVVGMKGELEKMREQIQNIE